MIGPKRSVYHIMAEICNREKDAIEVYAMLDAVLRGPIDTLLAWLRGAP